VDRARTQIGRISTFGLLELSRQRLRPSVVDAHFARCETCAGTGWVRSPASAARHILRGIEQELSKGALERLTVAVHSKLALALLNQFRIQIIELEEAHKTNIVIDADDSLAPPTCRFDRFRGSRGGAVIAPVANESVNMRGSMADMNDENAEDENFAAPSTDENLAPREQNGRRRYRGRGANRPQDEIQPQAFDGGIGDHHNHPAATEVADIAPIPAPPGTEFGVRPGRGGRSRGRGRGRGPGLRRDDNYNNGQPAMDMAGAEQPSVTPDAFTHPKQDTWAQPQQSAPAGAVPSGSGETPAPQPAAAVTTAPVVTRVSADGEAAANSETGDGTARKGWWNKLMKA
jgi:ribonuclease E